MNKLKLGILSLSLCVALMSCYTHTHVVGNGGSGNPESKGQWYILYGLVKLNQVNSKDMAGGASNYTIKTEQSFLDGIISAFTSIVTVTKQTVTVTK